MMRTTLLLLLALIPLFSIAQFPYASVEGSDYLSTKTVHAEQGDVVILEIRPNDSKWKWTGPMSFSEKGAGVYILDFSEDKAGVYTATRNYRGEKQSFEFELLFLEENFAAFPDDIMVCGSQLVELNAYPGVLYQWNTGETTETISVLAEDATYSVTVSTLFGAVDTAQVTVSNVEGEDVVQYIEAQCRSLETIAGPEGYADYQWSNGENGSVVNFDFVSGDMISVFATNAEGCETRFHYTLDEETLLDQLEVSFEIGNGTPYSDGFLNLEIQNTGQDLPTYYVYVDKDEKADIFLGESNSNQFSTAIPVGFYRNLKVVSENACTYTLGDFDITYGDLFKEELMPKQSFCYGTEVELNAESGYDSYYWFDGSEEQAYNFQASSDMQIFVDALDSEGNYTRYYYDVEVFDIPSADIQVELIDDYISFNVSLEGAQHDMFPMPLRATLDNEIFLLGMVTAERIILQVAKGFYSDIELTSAQGCPIPLQNFSYMEELRPITEACYGEEVELVAPFGYSSYEWSDGTQDITYTFLAEEDVEVELVTIDDEGNIIKWIYPISVYESLAANYTVDLREGLVLGHLNISLTSYESEMFPIRVEASDLTSGTITLGYFNSESSSMQVGDGDYIDLTLITAQGCSTVLGDFVMKAAPTYSEFIQPLIQICRGEEVQLSGPSGPANYLWSDGTTSYTTTVSPLQSETVEVTATDLQDNVVKYIYPIQVHDMVEADYSVDLREGLVLGHLNIGLTSYELEMFPIRVEASDLTSGTITLGYLNSETTSMQVGDGEYIDLTLITAQGCATVLGDFVMTAAPNQKRNRVSGKVWLDHDIERGIIEATEDGLAGIQIVALNLEGDIKAETVTDADGSYALDLENDTYFLKFENTSGLTETLPHMGSEELINSDVDGSNGPGTTGLFNLNDSETSTAVMNGGFVYGALPIHWKSISVIHQGGFNEVEWAVDLEYNLSHYQVERSINNIENFISLGTTDFKVEEKVQKTYTFSDYNIDHTGAFYYRIKQVDINGNYSYSEIVSTQVEKRPSENENATLTMFPIPAHDRASLSINVTKDIKTLNADIYTIGGQLITSNIVQDTDLKANSKKVYTIPVENLLSGQYIIVLTMDNVLISKDLFVL